MWSGRWGRSFADVCLAVGFGFRRFERGEQHFPFDAIKTLRQITERSCLLFAVCFCSQNPLLGSKWRLALEEIKSLSTRWYLPRGAARLLFHLGT
jgi:hypothetical protein